MVMGKFLAKQDIRFFLSEGELHIVNLGYNDFSKPDLVPIHSARLQGYYTLHYVLSGRGVLILGENTYSVGAGSLFFLPPNQPILYYPDANDPWEYVWFAFNGERAAQYGELMGFSEQVPVLRAPHAIRLCLERLFLSLDDTGGDEYYLVLSAFYEIVHCCRQTIQPRSMASAKEIIDANFTHNHFSIDTLCRTLYISHSHLCRQFKAAYGMSVKQYLIARRLEHAKHLLTASDLPVKTVALSCGFNDELHFMKTFKAATGTTALAYRRAPAVGISI